MGLLCEHLHQAATVSVCKLHERQVWRPAFHRDVLLLVFLLLVPVCSHV